MSGAATFAGGTVDGSNILYTTGTTTVSAGLTIGGTVEWENTKSVTQSGGTVTIGDASGDKAILFNTSAATYDILDDSGIGLGASTASTIKNTGLFEKTGVTTGGTRTSVIAPAVTNTGTIEVTARRQHSTCRGRSPGRERTKSRALPRWSSNSTVAAGQTVSFTGSGGKLDLADPQGFAGSISGFDTVGAGSNDTIEVAGPGSSLASRRTPGARREPWGSSTVEAPSASRFIGNYNPADFTSNPGERKHADNLHRRLWVGFLAALRRERARRVGRRR